MLRNKNLLTRWLILTLLASFGISFAALGDSNLPPQAKADILKLEMYDLISKGEFSQVLEKIKAYKALGVEVAPDMLWLEARAAASDRQYEHSLQAVQEFLNRVDKSDANYPKALRLYLSVKQSVEQQQAQRKDDAAWQEAARNDQVLDYQNYLQQFPKSIHVQDADNALWRLSLDDVGQIRQYLKTLPHGKHVEEAEGKAWQAATKSASPYSYSVYLTTFPQGAHATQAESSAWAIATGSDSPRDYSSYLQGFPDGMHHEEARQGLKNAFARMISSKTDLDAPNEDGWTPLYIAVVSNDPESVSALIEAGADVNRKDRTGNTPLHHAVYEGNPQLVQALIDGGANLDVADANGKTALGLAVIYQKEAVARALIEAGADVNHPLDDHRFTLLHEAVLENRPALVRLLLDGGAKINALTDQGIAPVDEYHGTQGEAVRELIKGLKPGEIELGHTLAPLPGSAYAGLGNRVSNPLYEALDAGDYELAGIFLDLGADPSLRWGFSKDSVFVWAIEDEEDIPLELLKKMVRRGADPDMLVSPDLFQDGPTRTMPYLKALVPFGSIKAGRRLLELGAHVDNAKGVDGYNQDTGEQAIHLAASNGHNDWISMLVKFGADVNAKTTTRRNTPLIQAAAFGQLESAKLLVSLGAKVSIRNAYGISALDVAVRNGNSQLAAFLRQNGAR